MTRQEKIDFLKRLQAGKASLEEICPGKYKIIIGVDGEDTKFFKNDKPITEEEWNEMCRKMPKDEKVVFDVKLIDDDGNEVDYR